MNFLDSLLKQRERPRDIQAFIDSAMRAAETKPPMTPASRVRPSGIEGFCPRAEAIRARDGLTVRSDVTPRLARIFAAGRAYERYLRDTVLAPAGVLVGAWKCVGCGALHGEMKPQGARPRPDQCGRCGLPVEALQYVEPFGFVDKAGSNIGGSADGFILWERELGLLEVKTANDERFKRVSKARFPLVEHHSQAQVYMRVFRLPRTLFWYVNKNTGDHLALWVAAAPKVQDAMVAKAEALRRYFETGTLPERICQTGLCPRAKQCLVAETCFAPSAAAARGPET